MSMRSAAITRLSTETQDGVSDYVRRGLELIFDPYVFEDRFGQWWINYDGRNVGPFKTYAAADTTAKGLT